MNSLYDFDWSGGVLINATPSQAQSANVPQDAIVAAIKGRALREVATLADSLRDALASANAGKLQEWDIKAAIASAPATQFVAERAILTEEAQARGMTLAQLLSLVTERATAFRALALTIAKIEAQAKAAIAAIPDTALDLQAQVEDALSSASAGAANLIAASTTT